MKKHNYKVGDTVTVRGKQGIIEAFHKEQAAIFMVEDRQSHLVSVKSIRPCKDKYEKMMVAAK